VKCGQCQQPLDERSDLPIDERQPCPNCGSTTRTFEAKVEGRVTLTGSVDARIIRAWDGLTLTLAGVLYGIVVTLAGVAIAGHGWLPLALYLGLSVALLVAGLMWWQQAVIAGMRWLLERGKRTAAWPFRRF
jgi:hypothetical protein